MTRQEILSNGTVVCVSERVSFGRDPLLLARFCNLKRGRLLDIGSGCGIIPLELADDGFSGSCDALELDSEACVLAQDSFSRLDTPRFKAICCDARCYSSSEKYDAAVCNPPYYRSRAGGVCGNVYRNNARRDEELTLGDVARCAARNLKQKGKLFVCIPPQRLAALFFELRSHRLEPKNMQFILNGNKKRLALVCAVYDAGEGLEILEDIVEKEREQ